MMKKMLVFLLILSYWLFPQESFAEDISNVVENVLRGVVVVIGKGPSRQSFGSGFFVSSNGDVLTNFHVVEGMNSIFVKNHDKKVYPAEVKAFDKEKDMAVLSTNLPKKSFSVLPLAKKTPKIGTAVLAIGAPEGLEQSVSDGLVSRLRKFGNVDYLQISCPISRGSSGGLKWTRLSRQKIIEFLVCVKKNSDYLMLTFSAFSPEYTSQGVR
jgi:S1-C subfamily serine protease